MVNPTPPRPNERGSILILTALSMTVLLAIAALAIDTAFMYDKRNHLYAAADAAAKGAAIERWRSGNANLVTYAYHELSVQGINPTSTGTTVVVRSCNEAGATCNGSWSSSNTYVEVILSQQTNTFFGKILGWANLTPRVRAVAGASFSTNCVVIFDHMSFTNPATGSTVDADTCSIVVGGPSSPTSPATSDLLNYAAIDALSLGVVHTGAVGCDPAGWCGVSGSGTFGYGVPPPSDPLGSLPGLTDPAPITCGSPYTYTASETISVTDYAKYYCGFEMIGSGGAGTIVTFNPGTYYINGPITDMTGADIGWAGDGVMLYFGPSATITMDSSNNVDISMTAQTSGSYSGILMFQDRSAPLGNVVDFGKNNTAMAFKGALYFPRANITMKNENSPTMTNPCSLIVAWALEVDKPHFQFNNECLDFVGSPLLSATLAE